MLKRLDWACGKHPDLSIIHDVDAFNNGLVAELEHKIREYIAQHNTNPKPFVWTKSAEEILEKVIVPKVEEKGRDCDRDVVWFLAVVTRGLHFLWHCQKAPSPKRA